VNYEEKSEVLKALGHPVRLKIVDWLLNNDGCNVNKMVEKLGLPQSTVSQHLGILKNKGIIASTKKGVLTCYNVVDKQMTGVVKLLEKQ